MPRKLTLVIHSLEGGGAERTMAAMANHWAADGDQITLITLSGVQSDVYSLEPQVRRVALDEMQDSRGMIDAVRNNWRRVRKLSAAIKQSAPDCVIAFTPVINVLTRAACGKRFPVIIAERVDPRRHEIGGFWRRLRDRFYPRCAALVVQTRDVADYFAALMPRERITVIPNCIAQKDAREIGATNDAVIVAVGRLDRQKGFDRLLSAFAEAGSAAPEWKLRIFGEGAERESLETQVGSLQLDGRVSFEGWTSELDSELRRGSVFALSSRYEGFPNALLEAMAAGVACVSFDCPSGPSEIIRHDTDGLLILDGDVAAFAAALKRLMLDAGERERLGRRAREVAERFSCEKFYAAWDEVIERVRGS